MQTRWMDMTSGIPQDEMEEAGEIIREGGLVAFPTETVYGLGGNALDPQASMKIYSAKGRPSDNPLIVHIAELKDLYPIVADVPESALKLAEAFWPGPLTMIMNRSQLVPVQTTGGLDTVAVRMPSHEVARELIRAGGGYIAAPSANTSGRPSPTKASHVKEDLDGRIDAIIDGGDVGIGLESTIVDLTEDIPVVLRPGYISLEMLQDVLPHVQMDRAFLTRDAAARPKAPGMKYRHYAPKAQMTIVEGDSADVIRTIRRAVSRDLQAGKRVGIIAGADSAAQYPEGTVVTAGDRQEEITIAMHLYGILRDFDEIGVDVIYSEAFDTPQLGGAIMNRLIKAAGHQIIQADTSEEGL